MRHALLVLSLIAACHPDRVAKPRQRTVEVAGGVPVAVTVFGPDTARETLVIVTGGPGLSHDYATPLAALASRDLRVVFYDQRGTGTYGRLRRMSNITLAPLESSIEAYVLELEAIRVALHANKIHLLGHSWGSLVAQTYALAAPERVTSLIMLSGLPPTSATALAGLERADKRYRQLVDQGLIPKDLPEPAAGGDCTANFKALVPALYADPRFPPGGQMAQVTCDDVMEAAFKSLGETWDYRPLLSTLKVPSLVMTGAADLFGVEWTDELAAAIPGAKKVIVPECGILLWDECPDALFGELRAFLK